MDFINDKYMYPSKRQVVYAKNGMVHSSAPLAAQIGVDILKKGGNAIDASIAMATSLPLLEPTGNGLGSDCFALIWYKDKLYGINGSGVSPKALTAQAVRDAGFKEIPEEGWLSTMVPGAPSAWEKMRSRFGTMSMEELMAPAISYAEEGFPIPETVSKQWAEEAERYQAVLAENPEVFQPWFDYFTKGGKPYAAGDLFKNPDYAKTLRSLAATNCESYYNGEIMEQIVAFSKKTGGYFTEEDFQSYEAEWVEPISTVYKGYEVCEIPPNGHGITALMALNILKGFHLDSQKETAENYHKMIESIKLAFVDTKKYVADPRCMTTKVSQLLSEQYADNRRSLIGKTALMPEAGDPHCGGTVYFCTADKDGNMVSFIQSNYARFGSGIVVPGTGITLQDRGANFSMDPESDNYLEGGKKAYHTIIPGFLMKDGKAVGPFGVMGGFMQPQGHLQVIVNTIDFHMNPQTCLDAPRFQWVGEKKVQLEREVSPVIAQTLADKRHQITIVNSNIGMGRGGIIWRMENGVYAGGTECRCDGTIAAW